MLCDDFYDSLKSVSDIGLVQLYRNGDQAAFQQLAMRYYLLLKKKAAAFACSIVESDDLLQEGLLGLHSAACTFSEDGRASFRTYAEVCIRNRLSSYVRRMNSRKSRINDNCAPIEEISGDVPSSPEHEPENAMISAEELDELEKYIRERLSKTEYSVMSLYIEGRTYEQISKALGISVKSCDNAMQRARKKIRDRI